MLAHENKMAFTLANEATQLSSNVNNVSQVTISEIDSMNKSKLNAESVKIKRQIFELNTSKTLAIQKDRKWVSPRLYKLPRYGEQNIFFPAALFLCNSSS